MHYKIYSGLITKPPRNNRWFGLVADENFGRVGHETRGLRVGQALIRITGVELALDCKQRAAKISLSTTKLAQYNKDITKVLVYIFQKTTVCLGIISISQFSPHRNHGVII